MKKYAWINVRVHIGPYALHAGPICSADSLPRQPVCWLHVRPAGHQTMQLVNTQSEYLHWSSLHEAKRQQGNTLGSLVLNGNLIWHHEVQYGSAAIARSTFICCWFHLMYHLNIAYI